MRNYSSGTTPIYEVRNIKINGHGLFETLKGATIENIKLKNITVESESLDNVGCLTGYATEIRIENVEVLNSTISGRNNVGGLIGYCNKGIKIAQIYGKGNTISGTTNVGGLIGNSLATTINLCGVYGGSVKGIGDNPSTIGGLVGWNHNGSLIKQSTATATVSAANGQRVGGLVGVNASGKDGSTIKNCWKLKGNVSGKIDVGWLGRN